MALFKVFKGSSANLPTEMHDGYCYFTTDDGKFYIDYLDTDGVTLKRKPISGPGKSIEYIIGTQASSTNAWTGVSKDDELWVGKTIAYKLPYAGTSSAATLALTLSTGTVVTKTLRRQGSSAVTTHYPAGTVLFLTYDGTYWQTDGDYDSNDGAYYSRKIYPNIKAGANKIYPYTFIMQLPDGRWESPVMSSSTSASKTVNPHGFLLGNIYIHYYNGTTYTENQAVSTYSIYSAHGNLIDHRYSFNTENNSTNGTISYKPVYLVGSLHSDGLFYLDTTKWWSQTLPSTADGKLYIYLGDAYDYYRMNFAEINPIYQYVDGAVRQFIQHAKSAETVMQNASGNNNTNYRVLLSTSDVDTVEIGSLNKSSNLQYNPSTNKLSTGNLRLTGELDVTGNAYLHNQTAADSLTAGSLLVTGNANFTQSPTAPTPASTSNDTTVATTEFVKSRIAAGVTGVKGNAEGSYRVGNVNLTGANIIGSSAIGSSTKPIYWTGSAFSAITSYEGNSATATGFASAKTIALTGNVTGSATGGNGSNGWSIATTIGTGVVTNAMLAGSIANGKLANSSISIAGNSVSLGGSLAADTLRTSLGLSNAMHFIGVATVAITDGSTTNPTISGYDFTADRKPGDVIIDSDTSYEYVWTLEGKWERLGPDGSYKTVQSAVSSPSASGNATAFIDTISQNANGVITVTKKNLDTSGTWSGNAATATQFSSNATVTLTGDTTGTSAGSKKSWSVPTITKYITGLGRRTTAAAINLNPSVDTGFKLTWHLSDSTSRTNDATNSPSFDGAIINLPWDWGGYNGQIALQNTMKGNTRMQIRSATSVDNGADANPRYSSDYGAWREVVTTAKATQVGSSSQPVYVSNTGQVTAITGAIANDITGTANKVSHPLTLANNRSYDGSADVTLLTNDLTPVLTKTYPAYTCSADNEAKGVLFFGRVTNITSSPWQAPWAIHYRVYVSTTENNTQGWYDCYFSVSGSTVNYYNYNNFYSTDYRPIYHHRLLYPKSGYTSYGAYFGVRVQSARTPTTLARTFKVELIETKNCTVEFLENIQRFDETYITTNSVAASTIWYNTDYNATAVGLQEAGDANTNDTAYYVLTNGFRGTASTTYKLWRYGLFGRTADGTYESFTNTSGTATTKTKNPHGFLPEGKIYWNSASGTDYSGTISFSPYEQYHSIDYRYTFNISTTGLPANCNTYLKWTYNPTTGLLYLADEWLATALPTTEDGFIYQRIGSNYYGSADYRGSLLLNNPYYIYTSDGIKVWTPQNFTITGGTNKIIVSPLGSTSYDVTVTPSIANNITGSGTSGYLTKFNGTNTITNGPQLSSAISSQSQTTKFLREDGTWAAPSYTDAGVTGVKGNAESSYRTGNVNLTSANILGTGTTAQFWRGDNSWSNILTQTAATTLGIDTSNSKIGTAVRTLHIATSNSGSGTGVTDGQAAGLTFGIATAAYAGIYYQSSGSYGSRLYFATTGSFANGAYARMMITHDGKVGIGTTSPTTLLHVAGDVTVTGLTASQAVSTDANKKLVSTNLTVSDPTASGTGITYIATISQSAVGKITVTKSTVRSASTSQTGVLQFTAENTNAQLNTLTTGSSTPTDADYYISQYVGGGTTTTTYHRRPMSALWDYIKGKITNGIYWANEKATSSASYKTTPEVAKIKLNGNTSASAASTKNVELVYDATLEVLNFVFS